MYVPTQFVQDGDLTFEFLLVIKVVYGPSYILSSLLPHLPPPFSSFEIEPFI